MLARSMALVNRLLAQPRSALAFSNADPLQINLPPLGYGGGVISNLRPEALQVLASLYFQSELEQATIIPLAELLTESRYSLQLTDHSAAALLEQFAEGMQARWLKRQIREQIFARTFGTGAALLHEPGTAVNRNFETLFARLCQALVRFDADTRWQPPGAAATVAVEMAAQQVVANLAQRQFGNTLTAAQRIQGQLQAALELLNHPSIPRLFQAHDVWSLIRSVLGSDAPDLNRLVNRAQNGLRLLTWLAQHLGDLNNNKLFQTLNSSRDAIVWAAGWLQATGVASEPASSPSPWSGYNGATPAIGGVFSATRLLRSVMEREGMG